MEIFTAFGLSAGSGLNAYIPLLVVALLARFTDTITLNPPWDALTNWVVIALLILLTAIEFFADKIPGINHANDLIQTFIRPTAGAIAFAASSSKIAQIHPVLALCAGLIIAGGVHAVKTAVVRPAVTVATAGAGHPAASFLEDVVATVVSVLAILVPVIVGGILIIGVVLLVRRFASSKAS